MERKVTLNFIKPVDEIYKITPDGGEYGAARDYGPHKGVDYFVAFVEVNASEDGVVVYSDERKGTEIVTNYGNVIVIDHTPKARDKERHIYTLYAHLETRLVGAGTKVAQGKKIGISGNTGTKEYHYWKKHGEYKGAGKGRHLHFEVIDSPKKIAWSESYFPKDLSIRKDPLHEEDGYIDKEKIIKYSFTDEEMKKVYAHVDYRPAVDWKSGRCHMDWYVGGRYKGRTDKHKKKIDLKLTSMEIEEILSKPLPPSKTESRVYEVKIS